MRERNNMRGNVRFLVKVVLVLVVCGVVVGCMPDENKPLPVCAEESNTTMGEIDGKMKRCSNIKYQKGIPCACPKTCPVFQAAKCNSCKVKIGRARGIRRGYTSVPWSEARNFYLNYGWQLNFEETGSYPNINNRYYDQTAITHQIIRQTSTRRQAENLMDDILNGEKSSVGDCVMALAVLPSSNDNRYGSAEKDFRKGISIYGHVPPAHF